MTSNISKTLSRDQWIIVVKSTETPKVQQRYRCSRETLSVASTYFRGLLNSPRRNIFEEHINSTSVFFFQGFVARAFPSLLSHVCGVAQEEEEEAILAENLIPHFFLADYFGMDNLRTAAWDEMQNHLKRRTNLKMIFEHACSLRLFDILELVCCAIQSYMLETYTYESDPLSLVKSFPVEFWLEIATACEWSIDAKFIYQLGEVYRNKLKAKDFQGLVSKCHLPPYWAVDQYVNLLIMEHELMGGSLRFSFRVRATSMLQSKCIPALATCGSLLTESEKKRLKRVSKGTFWEDLERAIADHTETKAYESNRLAARTSILGWRLAEVRLGHGTNDASSSHDGGSVHHEDLSFH